MNLFSCTPFLESVAAAGFAGLPFSLETYRLEDRDYRLLTVAGRPVTAFPFLDFVEPLEARAAAPAAVRPLAYHPAVARATLEADAFRALPRVVGEMPSPFIDWTRFRDYADFVAHRDRVSAENPGDLPRRIRRLERELGPLAFVFDDRRPEAMAACVRWKSAQYVASGLRDLFADPRLVALFEQLRQRGLLVVSSLQAGDTLLAVHLGALWEGRFYYWVPAYDVTHRRGSPGRILLERMLEGSHALGHREFDFLIGDEEYKWSYATHTRVVGPAGRPPLSLRVGRAAKGQLKRVLQRVPGLWERLRQLKRRLRR